MATFVSLVLFSSTLIGPLRCPDGGPQRLIPPWVTTAPLSIRSSVSPPPMDSASPSIQLLYSVYLFFHRTFILRKTSSNLVPVNSGLKINNLYPYKHVFKLNIIVGAAEIFVEALKHDLFRRVLLTRKHFDSVYHDSS